MALDLSGIPVLVVDDHEDSADLFAAILEGSGAIVHRASGMLEALSYFDRLPIKVIVTDIAMPGGTGWDLLREVRQRDLQQRPRWTRVIAVTARRDPGSARLIEQGFCAVLHKPVDPAELVAVVARLVR